MKKLLMIGVLALTMGQASAQRCLPKMQGIEVSGAFVDGKPLSAAFSGGVALSTYTKNGSKWVFGGEYLQREYGYDEDTTIPVAQLTAEGGYYQKLLTDASKTLFIYGGVSALAGYESVNWGKTLLPDGATLQDRDAFVSSTSGLWGAPRSSYPARLGMWYNISSTSSRGQLSSA